MIDASTPNDSSSRSGATNDRSSAEVWYSGNRPCREAARQRRCHDRTGEVVVGQRGVADVRRDEDLVVGFTADHRFSVRKVARLQGRVDHDVVLALAKLAELPVREAETP